MKLSAPVILPGLENLSGSLLPFCHRRCTWRTSGQWPSPSRVFPQYFPKICLTETELGHGHILTDYHGNLVKIVILSH